MGVLCILPPRCEGGEHHHGQGEAEREDSWARLEEFPNPKPLTLNP